MLIKFEVLKLVLGIFLDNNIINKIAKIILNQCKMRLIERATTLEISKEDVIRIVAKSL